MIISWVRRPQFRSLPIDRPNETSDHRSCRLLNLCQPKIGNFCDAFGGDENIGGFTIPMYDGWAPCVEVLQASCNVKHQLQLRKVRTIQKIGCSFTYHFM